jgi:hypothetical protein
MGADFRGTEFGSPCAAVEEREKALGSEPDPSNGSGYRFKGRAFDRHVFISYLCKDGALALGDYHFPAGRYNDAVSDYLAAYDFFLALYGPPLMAYARHREFAAAAQLAVPSVGAATRDEYHASWNAQGLSVHVDLIAHGDYAGENWHAMVVTTPARK